MASLNARNIKLDPETFSSWYTASQALDYAMRCVGTKSAAKQALWSRISGGMIEAAASHVSVTQEHSAPVTQSGPIHIPKDFWANLAEGRSDLWGPGDATFYFLSNKMGYGSGTWFLFVGIRFNPNNIHSTLPLPSAETPAPGKRDDLSEGESEQRGPRVSDAHLAAWFDLWRKVYQGTPLDIEDIAVASARGMFQGKSVTRQQVRDLRGTQKRGRKPSDSAK